MSRCPPLQVLGFCGASVLFFLAVPIQPVAADDTAAAFDASNPANIGNITINAGNQLAMTNSSVTTEANQSSGGAIKKLLAAQGGNKEKAIEELYLRCLARSPTEKEMAKFKGFFGGSASDEQVLTDIFWALLNSKEFIFNH